MSHDINIDTRTKLIDLPATQNMLAQLNSLRSRQEYAKNIRAFDDWLNGRRFDRTSVLEYVSHCEKRGLAPATINQRLASIRGIVREAEAAQMIPYDVARPILSIRDRKARRVRSAAWLERDQILEILAGCSGTPKSVRDRALFAVAIATGLRQAELASLTWSQLTRRRRKYFLMGVATKGGKIRDIVIQESAMKWLNKWGKLSGKKGPIFKRIRKGGTIQEAGISARAISQISFELCKAIGIPIAAHDLRRTYANLLYEAQVPVREIQRLLGHSSIKTTEEYLKPIKDAQIRDDYFTF